MELKQFVSETIKQITDGLLDGDKYIKEKYNGIGLRNQSTKVRFDVAVTTNEEEKTDLGGKINVVKVFSAGASNESINKTSNYSRVEFEIFMNVKK